MERRTARDTSDGAHVVEHDVERGVEEHGAASDVHELTRHTNALPAIEEVTASYELVR